MNSYIGQWVTLTVGAVAVTILAVFANGLKTFDRPIQQPFPFNHKKHLEADLTCLNCHSYADRETFASIPKAQKCVRCHESEEIDKPETEKIRQLVERGEEIPWVRVYQVPAHTFFSHRRHVRIAKLECAVCHGDMTQVTEPVTRQMITIRMDACIDCHRKQGVTEDCLACHR